AVCPLLASVGISHHWDVSENDKGAISVTCALTHQLGHKETVTLSAPPDASGKKNAIQQKGSTITYLERYTFLALVGLATVDQDDDGKHSSEEPDGITQSQGMEWVDAISGGHTAEEVMATWTNATNAAKKLNDYKAMTIFTEARDTKLKELKHRRAQ